MLDLFDIIDIDLSPGGPRKGRTVDVWPPSHESYKLMGWSPDGVPPHGRLAELGLREAANAATEDPLEEAT